MAEQENNPKSKTRIYKRPGFILLLLTGFLWLAFLFKIFLIPEVQVESASNITPLEKSVSTEKTSSKEPIKLQSAQARSRNKLSNEQISAREDQDYIEALRESFDKVKPGANNQVIRGEFIPVKKEPPRKALKNNHNPIQILVDDKFEMNSLNAEYRRALRGRN